MSSLRKPQNSSNILLDWTGFRLQHRKLSPKASHPTHCAWAPITVIVPKLCVWERISYKVAKCTDSKTLTWAVCLPYLQRTNTKVMRGSELYLGMNSFPMSGRPLYLGGTHQPLSPTSELLAGWVKGGRYGRARISVRVRKKISSATLFWTSRVMSGKDGSNNLSEV